MSIHTVLLVLICILFLPVVKSKDTIFQDKQNTTVLKHEAADLEKVSLVESVN